MERNITISGKSVPFKATAGTIRIYRSLFGRDLLLDFKTLQESMGEDKQLTADALTIFENLAYTMAKQADPEGVPSSPDEWLDEFDMFSIYEVLPQLVALWGISMEPTAKQKKNLKSANLVLNYF